MTTTTSLLRAGSALAAAVLLIGMLSACTPEAKPTSKPTNTAAFATDEEAFAAAEKTYREFVDAQNQVDLENADSLESVYRWTAGDALIAVRESLTELKAEKAELTGESRVVSLEALESDPSSGKITMHVCVDVSDTDVIGPDGQSLVPPDRANIQSLRVDFSGSASGGMKVSRTSGDETPCPA